MSSSVGGAAEITQESEKAAHSIPDAGCVDIGIIKSL